MPGRRNNLHISDHAEKLEYHLLDSLEVGNFVGELNVSEARTHFGAWCVVSSPLMLSTDLEDEERMELIWPIISNTEVCHTYNLLEGGTSNREYMLGHRSQPGMAWSPWEVSSRRVRGWQPLASLGQGR